MVFENRSQREPVAVIGWATAAVNDSSVGDCRIEKLKSRWEMLYKSVNCQASMPSGEAATDCPRLNG